MSKIFKVIKQIGKTLVITLPVAVTFFDTVGYVAMVEGVSMQPSLNPDVKTNDYVYLNKWAIRNYEVEKGDIVALICPHNPHQKLIKRVIALEGEVIRSTGKKRWCTVPSGYCWVEGDHQRQSMDSNYFGPVSLGLIFAKASHVVWPPNRWQKLESPVVSDDTQRVFRLNN